MTHIALLNSGTSFIAQQFQDLTFAASIAPLDMYDLPSADLSPYCAMLVPGSVDQEWCLKHAGIFSEFLAGGKVVAFSGAIFRPWLPGASSFVPKKIRSRNDYTLQILSPGGIFEGVAAEDLTRRKGVAGFFARGYHPLPPGAEALVAFESGEPVVYVDRVSTPGTILVHSGNDLWSFGIEGSTSQRILPQLVQWVEREHAILHTIL